MFFNTDMYELYLTWASTSVPWLDVTVGVILFAVGVAGSFLLTKYELSHEG